MDTKLAGLTKWTFGATILISAFLLFQVQPIISKAILAWFGGSPAVWTTSMLFFQVMLLAGYAYAHLLASNRTATWSIWIHGALLIAAICFLPIRPSPDWQPSGGEDPRIRILLLLAATVGLPYFLLSATGPLMQAWFYGWSQGRSPYRFYALSNLGSLGALLSYPFLFEVLWPTSQQIWFWSTGFVLFVLGCVICGFKFRQAEFGFS